MVTESEDESVEAWLRRLRGPTAGGPDRRPALRWALLLAGLLAGLLAAAVWRSW